MYGGVLSQPMHLIQGAMQNVYPVMYADGAGSVLDAQSGGNGSSTTTSDGFGAVTMKSRGFVAGHQPAGSVRYEAGIVGNGVPRRGDALSPSDQAIGRGRKRRGSRFCC